MRVVFDTNVIVSGLLTPAGTCARLLDFLLEGMFELRVDRRISAEYEEVLLRPELSLPAEDVGQLLQFLAGIAEQVCPKPLSVNLPDAGDLPFLEVAAATNALLVSGNKRHYPPGARCGVTVLSPGELLDLLPSAS